VETPPLFLPQLAAFVPLRPEFSTLKRYSIFSLARALGKLHKKILKLSVSLCILTIDFWLIIGYNNTCQKGQGNKKP
jgi:hypothetical protein